MSNQQYGNGNYNNNNQGANSVPAVKSTYVKIAGLYERQNDSGETYFTGKMGDVVVELRVNKFRQTDTQPTHNLYIVDRPKNQNQNAGGANNGYSQNNNNNNYNNGNGNGGYNNNKGGYKSTVASKPYTPPTTQYGNQNSNVAVNNNVQGNFIPVNQNVAQQGNGNWTTNSVQMNGQVQNNGQNNVGGYEVMPEQSNGGNAPSIDFDDISV